MYSDARIQQIISLNFNPANHARYASFPGKKPFNHHAKKGIIPYFGSIFVSQWPYQMGECSIRNTSLN
jgi:hypothetical protein